MRIYIYIYIYHHSCRQCGCPGRNGASASDSALPIRQLYGDYTEAIRKVWVSLGIPNPLPSGIVEIFEYVTIPGPLVFARFHDTALRSCHIHIYIYTYIIYIYILDI